MAVITCQRCGMEVVTKSSRRKFCETCSPIADKERKAAYLKEWQKANPEKCRTYSLEWHRENPEKVAACDKRWKAENPEKVAAKMHRNYERYKEKRHAQSRQWVIDHPEETNASRRVRNHNRRAREAQAEGKWTFEEFKALCEAYDNRCAYCNEQTDKLTADHMTPIARGGENTIENIIPACGKCNSSKGTKTVLEFLYPKARILPASRHRTRKKAS